MFSAHEVQRRMIGREGCLRIWRVSETSRFGCLPRRIERFRTLVGDREAARDLGGAVGCASGPHPARLTGGAIEPSAGPPPSALINRECFPLRPERAPVPTAGDAFCARVQFVSKPGEEIAPGGTEGLRPTPQRPCQAKRPASVRDFPPPSGGPFPRAVSGVGRRHRRIDRSSHRLSLRLPPRPPPVARQGSPSAPYQVLLARINAAPRDHILDQVGQAVTFVALRDLEEKVGSRHREKAQAWISHLAR